MMRPKGSDKSFVGKTSTMHGDLPFVSFPKFGDDQFTITHYAGAVTYTATGFLDKHKDALLPDLEKLLQESDLAHVQELFPRAHKHANKTSRRRKSALSAASVGS